MAIVCRFSVCQAQAAAKAGNLNRRTFFLHKPVFLLKETSNRETFRNLLQRRLWRHPRRRGQRVALRRLHLLRVGPRFLLASPGTLTKQQKAMRKKNEEEFNEFCDQGKGYDMHDIRFTFNRQEWEFFWLAQVIFQKNNLSFDPVAVPHNFLLQRAAVLRKGVCWDTINKFLTLQRLIVIYQGNVAKMHLLQSLPLKGERYKFCPPSPPLSLGLGTRNLREVMGLGPT